MIPGGGRVRRRSTPAVPEVRSRLRASRARLAAAGLLLGLGTALANPWGLPAEAASARDGRAPPPDWIQGTEGGSGGGTAAPGGAPGGGGYGSSMPAWPGTDAEPAVPAGRSTWDGWRQGGAAAPGPAEPPPDYRFRPDGAAAAPPPGWSGPPRGDAAGPGGDYRFRDQAPGPRTDRATWPDLGGYRFRPLTERERARQGADGQSRPVGPDPAWYPPFGPGPARSPGAPTGFGP